MNAEFKIKGQRIETERLILRSFKESDLEAFFAYEKIPGLNEMAGLKHLENLEEAKAILKSFIEEDNVFAICLKDSGQVIGSIGINKYGMEDKLSEFFNYRGREISFALHQTYWGQGMMPEAAQAIINYLFEVIDLDFIICGYYEFNTQSKRVQEKLGFKPYRKLIMDTARGTKEVGILSLLINPHKLLKLEFSHPETLIYEE